MQIAGPLRLAVIAVVAALVGGNAIAAETNIAVAANFTDAAKEIAAAFKQKTGHKAVLSFGATGQFYTQITQDAPFQVFLSADDERPKKLVDDGLAVADSRFTYAIGKLVLWSKTADLVKGEETLKDGAFAKIAIANPTAAPYGAAAIEIVKSAQALRNAAAEDRPGQQHRADLPVRRNRQCRARLRRPVAACRQSGRLALGRAAEPLHADPAGRGAAEEGRRQRGGRGLPRLPQGTGGARRSSRSTATTERRRRELIRHEWRAARHLATDPADDRARGHHDDHPAAGRHADRVVAGALEGVVEGGGRGGRRAAAGAAADRARLLSAGHARAERAGRPDRRPVGRAHARLHLRGAGHRLGASTRCRSWCSRSATPSRRSAIARSKSRRRCAPRRGAPSGRWRCRWRGRAF